MALIHISLYPKLKSAIVSGDGLNAILKIVTYSKSKPLLTLYLASLAIEPTNKALISRSGCFHALGDLILGNHVDVNVDIQISAVCAILNTLYTHDANRRLAVELNIIKPLLTVLQTSTNEKLLTLSVRVFANMSFRDTTTAHSALLGGAGDCLATLLGSIDFMKQSQLAHAILAALANMCGKSDLNQTAIGNIDRIGDIVLRILEFSR
jgi:signal transduction histidine kinase